MYKEKRKAIFLFFILFFSIACSAISFEELPKAIEVIGIIEKEFEIK